MERGVAVRKFPLQFTEYILSWSLLSPEVVCHDRAVNQPFTCNVTDSLHPDIVENVEDDIPVLMACG